MTDLEEYYLDRLISEYNIQPVPQKAAGTQP